MGFSANAAYRHFAHKSDLLAAVAEFGARRQAQYILRAISGVSAELTADVAAVERVKAAGRAYVEFAVDHPALVRLMAGADDLPSEPGRPLETDPYALLGKALDDLLTEGVLPAKRRPGAELKAWTVVHGFAWLVIQGAPR